MADNLSGQYLGRYHILAQLGEGGMATVFKAFDTRLERDVAIKIIRKGVFPPDMLDEVYKRFEREAKSLARLSHPNIVKVHDYGEYEGSPYFVLEYLPGGSLKEKLGQKMPWQEAVKILLPIAQGLEYAHARGIIHRDIKPGNILLTESGEPMLSDFGIAKILEAERSGMALTGTGMTVGTPEYMAPEQWVGQTGYSSDIYSMGVVLYELITGRKPYIADTPAAIFLKQLNEPLLHPSQYVENLPRAVENILLKALAKTPEDRYFDMSAFVQALAVLSSGESALHVPKDRGVETAMPSVQSIAGSGDETKRSALPSPKKGRPGLPPWVAIAGGGAALLIVIVVMLSLFGNNLPGASGQMPTASAVSSAEVAILIATEPEATQTVLLPTSSPRPTRTLVPTLTATPEPVLCSQNQGEALATVILEIGIGADTTGAPLIISLGKKGTGWEFVGAAYTCRMNQPGDLVPNQVNAFSFSVPLKFCEMDVFRLTMLNRSKENMAEFKSLSLKIDDVKVWGDTSIGEDPDRINVSDTMGGWAGTGSYKVRCSP